jgi:hypothetical protein
MAQSNAITAIGAVISKAGSAVIRSCNPRARIVRRRLREIADGQASVGTIGAAWAAERCAEPACLPWALAA